MRNNSIFLLMRLLMHKKDLQIFSGAEFKSFQTYLAAQAYLSTNSDPTPDNLPQ
jgi:hypothetical protein